MNDSQSESLLKRLIEKAKEEKYYDLAAEEFDKIKVSLEPHIDKDLQTFQMKSKNCSNEIVSRFYYQKGVSGHQSGMTKDSESDK